MRIGGNESMKQKSTQFLVTAVINSVVPPVHEKVTAYSDKQAKLLGIKQWAKKYKIPEKKANELAWKKVQVFDKNTYAFKQYNKNRRK